MKPVEVHPKIYWVGALDWDIRDFHGYIVPRGTSYNAYLIVDEKVVLVDTVKHHLAGEMMARISHLVDPSRIDAIVLNHIEMDHAGSLAQVTAETPDAQIIVSGRGKPGLLRYHQLSREPEVVDAGDQLDTGSLTLQFLPTPMVHWPDSMVSYIPQAKVLLSNDAFGQHLATPERFDDQVGWDVLKEEAGKYYANIVLPYGDQVKKAMEAVSSLEVDTIAPSHGVIWRSYLDRILGEYAKWADNQTETRALIVYDSMWGSTEMMAQRLRAGLEESGIPVTLRSLGISHRSEVIADLLTARLVLVGSPTLNNGMLPTVSSFLTYLKGLRPRKRVGLAFGSHGWGGQGAREVDDFLRSLKWDMPREALAVRYRPDPEELDEAQAVGRMLGEQIKD